MEEIPEPARGGVRLLIIAERGEAIAVGAIEIPLPELHGRAHSIQAVVGVGQVEALFGLTASGFISTTGVALSVDEAIDGILWSVAGTSTMQAHSRTTSVSPIVLPIHVTGMMDVMISKERMQAQRLAEDQDLLNLL